MNEEWKGKSIYEKSQNDCYCNVCLSVWGVFSALHTIKHLGSYESLIKQDSIFYSLKTEPKKTNFKDELNS